MNSNGKHDNCIVVFSGFNQRALIAFLRTLSVSGVNYSVIAVSTDDPIFLTCYKTKVEVIRNERALVLEDLIDSLNKLKVKNPSEKYIIAPTTEALNRFILVHRQEFEHRGFSIPLVDRRLYESISDKYSFGQICLQNGISVPHEVIFSEPVINFPVVAKPRKYQLHPGDTGLAPVILENISEFMTFLNTFNIDDFYLQEFIQGKSFYLLYYFSRSGETYAFSQQNLIQQPEGKSIIAAISSDLHHSPESKLYERLFRNMNFYGFVMVEIRQDSEGENYMIEANPRFWGPSQLFVDAGVDFFAIFLHDMGIMPKYTPISDPRRIAKYFWFGGLIQTIKERKEPTYHSYSKHALIESACEWLQCDVYNRPDTYGMFAEEVMK